jgi:hypothetical protein
LKTSKNILEAGHCADMYPSYSGEPSDLEATRQFIQQQVYLFLTNSNGGPTSTTASSSTPSSGGCVDVDSTCSTMASDCSNALYLPVMCKYCRKTCNLCGNPKCNQ